MAERAGHRPALNGLRGVAILGVIAVHTAHRLLPAGLVGVDVFFVISGFLITRLLVEELDQRGALDLHRFYRRRFLRIVPPLVAMLVVVAAWEAFGAPSSGPLHPAADIVPAATYLMNFARGVGHSDYGLVGHTWSLATEEQFYVLWPITLLALLAVGNRRLAIEACIGGALVETLARLAYLHAHGSVPTTLPWFRSDGILVGSALALAWKAGRTPRVGGLPAIIAGAVLLWAARQTDSRVIYPISVPAAVLAGAVLVLYCLGTVGGPLTSSLLQRVGERSYGLYLWHVPVWSGLTPIIGTWGGFSMLWVLPVSWCVASLSWRFVEQPALRMRDAAESPHQAAPGLLA